jgi:hypothetical protein
MEIRRKLENVTPQYEDAGLFQNTVCRVELELVPIMHKNNRGDLIVMGLVKGDLEIAATFAGRRVTDAASIIESLNELLKKKDHLADVRKSRLPLRIDGAWRPQFVSDGSGFEKRTFHLIVAKWAVMTANGPPREYGHPPAHMQPTAA